MRNTCIHHIKEIENVLTLANNNHAESYTKKRLTGELNLQSLVLRDFLLVPHRCPHPDL